MWDVFSMIFKMSVTGGVVIGLILLIRWVLKKRVSSTLIYLLWALALMKLLIPYGFESTISIFNVIDIKVPYEKIEVDEKDDFQGNLFIKGETGNPIDLKAQEISPVTVEAIEQKSLERNKTVNWMEIIAYGWVGVTAVLLALFIILYIRMKFLLSDKIRLKRDKTFRKMTRIGTPVYESHRITSPIILGMLKPVIVIPRDLNFTEEQLSDILEHEKVHIHRRDNIIKPMAVITVCIHWFNPLVWIGYFAAMKDMELSCDELVLRSYEREKQCHYADTLLKISMHQNKLLSHGFVAFGEKNIASRIKSILSFKKIPLVIRVMSPILIILLFFIFIGHEKSINKPEVTSEDNSLEIPIEIPQDLSTAELLDIIISSPSTSSNPGDYIAQHQEEYDQIQSMGQVGMMDMIQEFEQGGQTGLRGHIMMNLLRNMLFEYDISLAVETGQEWYDEIKAYTIKIAEANSYEFVLENYPPLILLLDRDNYYYGFDMVNFSDGQVEIAGMKLGYETGEMDSLLEFLNPMQIEQIMYRSVIYYKSAYHRDYGAMKRFSDATLKERIESWQKRLRENNLEELDGLMLMKLNNYSDMNFPVSITTPKKEGDNYLVTLNMNTDSETIITFIFDEQGEPRVTQFLMPNLALAEQEAYTYAQVQSFADSRGYDQATIMDNQSSDTPLTLFLHNGRKGDLTEDNLEGMLLKVTRGISYVEEESFRLNDGLLGYNFAPKYGDFTGEKYILGIRMKLSEDYIESAIVCIPKDNLNDLIILNTFEQPFMSQGDIPTIIDFTLVLVGDYILYQDIDLYWKVQNIETKTIYSSKIIIEEKGLSQDIFNTETEEYTKTRFIDPNIFLVTSKDRKTLVFNTRTLQFEILEVIEDSLD